MDLKEVSSNIDQSSHWYYATKYIPLEKFVSNILKKVKKPLTIIDIGSGTGFFALKLEARFQDKIDAVLLVDTGYTNEEIETSKSKKIQKANQVPENIKDSILIMMDVLEHIEYDGLFLKEVIDKSKGANYFFITVPAFQSLWSYHDVFLGHYRRYTLGQLKSVCKKEGIKISASYYLFALLLPIVWLMRKVVRKADQEKSDLKQDHKTINALAKLTFTAEMYFAKLNKIGGLSCCIEGHTIK